jgi:hypothetical protein
VVWKIALLVLAYIDLVSINHLVFQADVIVIVHVHFWTSIAFLDAFHILSLPLQSFLFGYNMLKVLQSWSG